MVQIVDEVPQQSVKSKGDTDSSKFYTLETQSKRPFILVRANATVGEHKQEDQWHWVALGSVKNRKTGFVTFEQAIDQAVKGDNIVNEHDSMSDAYTYLSRLAESYTADTG